MEKITMEELSKKTLAELRELAKELNIKSVTKYKKGELVDLITSNSQDATNNHITIQEKNIQQSPVNIERTNYTNAETQNSGMDNIEDSGERSRQFNKYSDTENSRQNDNRTYAESSVTYTTALGDGGSLTS